MRTPGQSLQEARRELFEDYLLFPLLMVAAFWVVALVQWVQYLNQTPPKPWLWTAVTVAALAFAVFRFFRVLPKSMKLRQGVEGERAVGQYLERLREKGYHVFHDILGDGFNVDHVVIGPAGIFTIETKTWSKPTKGQAVVKFDGESVSIGGLGPDKRPIIQARAQAGWLRELLQESTGLEVQVHPVILFPGWYIEKTGTPTRPLWVLEPKGLPKYLDVQNTRLTREKINLLSYSLSRFIRQSEKEREARERSFWHTIKRKKSKLPE